MNIQVVKMFLYYSVKLLSVVPTHISLGNACLAFLSGDLRLQ